MVEVAGFEVFAKVADRPTGPVWRAADRSGRAVAVKQLVAISTHAGQRLRSECAVLAREPHPNLVPVLEVRRSLDGIWVIEEWVDSTPLDRVSLDLTSAQQAVKIATGVLRGLAVAHELGIVHGDVSPATILLTTGGVPRLIDFGLSGPTGLTGLPAAARFTSPESVQGRVLTPASDVFSAAAVLATLLTTNHGRTSAAASRPKIESVPVPLRPVLDRALCPDPDERCQSAGEFLIELRTAADQVFGATSTANIIPTVAEQRRAYNSRLTSSSYAATAVSASP
jgi:serine/threonine protein kinase